MAQAVHSVDEVLPAPKLFTLGLQHVLVMYAGAIAVPLIVTEPVGASLTFATAPVAVLLTLSAPPSASV